jgi:hypothetical protein
VPRLREELLRKRTSWQEWFVLGVPSAVLGLIIMFTPLVVLVLLVGGAFAVSAFQAGIEIAFAWPILRTLSWKRFRAWWEGVLIGYGLCGLTCLLFGRPLIVLGFVGLQRGPTSTALLLIITAVESLLAQWWVVRWRARQWNDPVPAGRLAAACLAAKALVAIPWSLIAVGALAR